MPVLLIICGAIGIAIGILGKKFTVADSEGFPFGNDQPSSTWNGRLIFILVGLFFLGVGIHLLLKHV